MVRRIYRRKPEEGKKRGPGVDKTGCAKGSRWQVIAEKRRGLPVAGLVHSARPGEITLVEATLESVPLGKIPRNLVGDKAYYSAKHRERFRERYGIELIAPIKRHYKNSTQDRRRLRRMKRRWKVERLNAWLDTFYRLAIRRERRLDHYQGLLDLACLLIYCRFLG